eukprot:scaffold34200_cov24-Cyclotella_meneghiniana.AAC.2
MLIEEWGKKGFHPMIMMDANADVSEKQLSDFMKENGVIDLITDIHSEDEPPSTYSRGKKRIDLILGDEHLRRAVVRAGSRDLHDGVSSSDHTMQYIDVDEKMIFGDDSFCPIQGYQREFRLYDIKKKRIYQEELKKIYDHQRIIERVNELAEKFEKKIQLDDEDIKDYNRLDNEIIRAIKAAAAKAGRVNFGYQRSKDLCEAGATIRLHKAILSSIRNNMEYNNKIINLAETLSLKLDDRAK